MYLFTSLTTPELPCFLSADLPRHTSGSKNSGGSSSTYLRLISFQRRNLCLTSCRATKIGALTWNGCKAMSEWTDVFMLGKVTDQLIILSLSLGGPHGSSSISLVLPNDTRAALDYSQVITHVVYVCCFNLCHCLILTFILTFMGIGFHFLNPVPIRLLLQP